MNTLEKKMINTLIDLKENHNITALKAEFEDEGTSMDEALRLKEMSNQVGLDLTIKIGGCGALKDMHDAREIGVNSVVAPMVESAYAMKKFVNATKQVFSESERERERVNFFVNIETIMGYNNLDDILSAQEIRNITGVVLGRLDMCGSMGLSCEDVNSEQIFNIANTLANKLSVHNKKLIIGGNVSICSLPFFKNLPLNSLYKFETRKIIFNAQKALEDKNIDKGILKAVEFEIMWLKNKRDFYGIIHDEDAQRLVTLENRYNKICV